MAKYRRPRYTQKDKNHAKILSYARDLGMITIDTSNIGGEVLDCIICWRGLCIPFEIKQPGKEDDLTPGERKGIRKLARVGVTAPVATDINDVLAEFDRLTLKR